jgi:condensin complex subunit 2
MKRNEREYAIDPLFHKRSAIFDSGGAKGLLLNVLSVHNGYELVFDAADLVDDSGSPTLHVAGGEVEDELRKMVQGLLPHNWQESEICPEYAERRKGSSVAMQHLLEQMPDEEPIETTTNRMDEDNDYNHEDNMLDMGPRGTMEPRKEGNQDDDDGMSVSFGGGQQRPDGEQSTYNAAAHNAAWDYVDNDQSDDGDEYRGAEETLLDARLQRIEQQEQETEILIQPNMELYEVADGPNAEYTYFNRDKLANWAGPEHWKHKMKPTKKHQGEDEEYQDEEGNIVKSAPAKSRGPRKAFKIDFTAPPPANLADLLQAGGTFSRLLTSWPLSSSSMKRFERIRSGLRLA